ncbi:MAG: hypothetical protein V3U14_01820, partial [candidate division NC10 bacterium]
KGNNPHPFLLTDRIDGTNEKNGKKDMHEDSGRHELPDQRIHQKQEQQGYQQINKFVSRDKFNRTFSHKSQLISDLSSSTTTGSPWSFGALRSQFTKQE